MVREEESVWIRLGAVEVAARAGLNENVTFVSEQRAHLSKESSRVRQILSNIHDRHDVELPARQRRKSNVTESQPALLRHLPFGGIRLDTLKYGTRKDHRYRLEEFTEAGADESHLIPARPARSRNIPRSSFCVAEPCSCGSVR